MPSRTILLLLLLLSQFLFIQTAEAASWPMFRCDCLHTGYIDCQGPASGQLRWSAQTGGYSSAIATAERVYVCGASELMAYNLSGDKLWSYTCGNTSHTSPAVAADGTIYVASADTNLYAINPDGTQKWKRNLEGISESAIAIGPDGVVYVTLTNGKIRAIRPDGTFKFTYAACSSISSTPSIAPDGTVYFGCDDGYVYALTSSGANKWRFATNPRAAVKSSPCIGHDGTVYVGSMGGYFYAIWPTGTQRWRFAAGGSIYSSPAINADGTIAFGSRDKNIYCLNANGTLKWKTATAGYVDSSPAIDNNGVVYVGSNDGSLYAINANGTQKWAVSLGTGITASPAIGTSGNLCIATVSGRLCMIGSDGTPPSTPVVYDDGIYTPHNNSLHAGWSSTDLESGVARYDYAIGTAPGGQDIVPFTSNGLTTNVTHTGLNLVNNHTYYFSIKAINSVGLVSDIGVSDGIKVDSSPPDALHTSDSGKYSTSKDSLEAFFHSSDNESGIIKCDVAVGTSPGATDILNWRPSASSSNETITGLNLTHGINYFLSIRAYNGAGLYAQASSDGILTDFTLPVVDQINVQMSSSQMKINVDASDSESGVDKVQVAVVTTPDVPANPEWKEYAFTDEIIFTGTYSGGTSYYILARVRNGAEVWSEVKLSDRVTQDCTPPTSPAVVDDGSYWSDVTVLHASWNSTDSESGVNHYLYCVGTSPGIAGLVPWTKTSETSVSLTGLALSNGVKYYFSVLAVNGVGLESEVGSSDGIIIDTTSPSIPVVVDNGEYSSASDTLHASWIATDVQSGIINYQYCIGTIPGHGDIVSWTSSSGSQDVTVSGLSLQVGVPYYFAVKAQNGAGKWSIAGVSDGIQFVDSAPAWPKFRFDASNCGIAPCAGCFSGKLRWKFQTEGYVESSPAIAGDGTIYIGSSDGKLYAISSGGSVRWTYQTGSSIDSSPAIGAGGVLYFGSYDGYFYCLQSNGLLKWKYQTGGMIWSSPVISQDGSIYFGSMDSYVYALNSNGALKWKYRSGGTVWSSPALDAAGNIYFGCGDGKFYSLAPTGALRWTYDTGSAIDSSPSVSNNGVIYFGSGDGYFYALRNNGTLYWRAYLGRVVDSSAAITSDGRIYVGCGGPGTPGGLYAFTLDGKALWYVDLSGGVRSSPIVGADGVIYVGSASGKLYSISRYGNILWSYATQQCILASAAIANNSSVIVGSDDGTVYCFKDQLAGDTTPPTTPVVTVAKRFITPEMSISASWTSSDAESDIQSYIYAVGTEPGSDDIVSWTNAGITTSIVKAGLPLKPGYTCYVSLIARNSMSLVSSVGVSSPITVAPSNPQQRLSSVKQSEDGTAFTLTGKVVTSVFSDCVFVEEVDRSSGIRCLVSSSDLHVGVIVDVHGTKGSSNGEAVVASPTFNQQGFTNKLSPLGISGRALVPKAVSLVQGLLVRIAGRVTALGDGYFILDDGSKLTARGTRGIEVRIDPQHLPPKWSWVAVNGIVCIENVDSIPKLVIRASSNDPTEIIKL